MLLDNGYKGVVIAGTGFGHVHVDMITSIRHGIENGGSFRDDYSVLAWFRRYECL